MKLLYKSLLFLMIFICSVGSVCATDTDNITVDNSLSDVISNVGIVNDIERSNNDNCCGAVAFQSALKENGINITLKEANKAIHSVNGTTSMQGLIDGARKYNLTAVPLKFNNSNLKTGFIVHMNINGTGHWASVNDFDNYALIITKDSDLHINTNDLTISECEKIIGSKHRKTVYVASAKSNKFHYKNCRWAHKIKSYNKITFKSRRAAINAGYSPCKVCCP